MKSRRSDTSRSDQEPIEITDSELLSIADEFHAPTREPGWYTARELAPAFGLSTDRVRRIMLEKLVPSEKFECRSVVIDGQRKNVYRRVKPEVKVVIKAGVIRAKSKVSTK